MSLMRTFSMMLGEVDFLGTYVKPYYDPENTTPGHDDGKTLPYPLTTFLMLMVFMVLMPILLMNLLIGLAVGDIESVRRNAQLKRLAMQVYLKLQNLMNLIVNSCNCRWFYTVNWRESCLKCCWKKWTKAKSKSILTM